MDETYNDGQGMLLLAQCYEENGDTDKANQLYQKLIQDYKDTEVASTAQKALDKQNGKSTDDTSEDTDSDTSADTQMYTDDTMYYDDTTYYDDGTTDGYYQ